MRFNKKWQPLLCQSPLIFLKVNYCGRQPIGISSRENGSPCEAGWGVMRPDAIGVLIILTLFSWWFSRLSRLHFFTNQGSQLEQRGCIPTILMNELYLRIVFVVGLLLELAARCATRIRLHQKLDVMLVGEGCKKKENANQQNEKLRVSILSP